MATASRSHIRLAACPAPAAICGRWPSLPVCLLIVAFRSAKVALAGGLVVMCIGQSGCMFSETSPLLVRAPLGPSVPNPMFVGISAGPQQQEWLWERTVTVLHDYHFNIEREDRFASVIETDYRTGPGVLEPWHLDSVGMFNRLESTLQPVRRKVQVSLFPSENGEGYRVGVEAWKEIEHLPGLAANSPGGATFSESTPLDRDLNPVVGQTAPSQWIRQGRDVELEQAILKSLSMAYSR